MFLLHSQTQAIRNTGHSQTTKTWFILKQHIYLDWCYKVHCLKQLGIKTVIMFKIKSSGFAILLLLIMLCIPLIIGNPDTYFYVKQHLRAVSGYRSTMPAKSKLECAFICTKDEKCGIANYDNLNSMCESVPEGMAVSYIAAGTTGRWEMLGKKIQNITIYNLENKWWW